MNIFQEIKNKLDIEVVYAHYTGNTVNRHKSLCVFHNDKTPSLSFKQPVFNCFSCGAKGDIFEFMSKYFNISNYEAAKKLNDDFNLHLITDNKPTRINSLHKAAELRINRERNERDKIFKEYDIVADKAIQAVRNAELTIQQNKFISGSMYEYAESDKFIKFLDATQLLDRASYIYDLFACNIINHKHDLYLIYGSDKNNYLKEIDKIL